MTDEPVDGGGAESFTRKVAAGWSQMGERLRASQVRAEVRRIDQKISRVRGELARHLLSSPGLSAEIPLTPRLAAAREQLRQAASESDETDAAREAEAERESRVEQERNQALDPLRQSVESAQRSREELRQQEEAAAREGLSIARRRDTLDRELASLPASGASEFETLRRRHAVEELEALERRAARLTLDREELTRRVRESDRRLAAARDEQATRAAEWDAPLAEARANRQSSEARLRALDRRAKMVFDEVSGEAGIWAESWQKIAHDPADPLARRLEAELAELVATRAELLSRLGTAAPRGTGAGGFPAEDGGSRVFLWIALAGFGMFLATGLFAVGLLWFWFSGRDERHPAPARRDRAAAASGIDTFELATVIQGLSARGLVLREESIAWAAAGALDGRRVYPFADLPGGVEIYAFASPEQAREARRRMGRLLPDPRDSVFTENSEQAGRFLMWGLAQFPPGSRRTLKAAFHSASHP